MASRLAIRALHAEPRVTCPSPALRERESLARRAGRVRVSRQIPSPGSLALATLSRDAGEGIASRYSNPFFFKISSALLASIVSVGSVIFFSTVWPAISFRPWRTPSAPGVA